MPTRKEEFERIALLQGTLDLLILNVLQLVPVHGQGIARAILRQSDEAFFVVHGSLYLPWERLEDNGLITAEWGVSENNRKARFYTLTPQGREQLTAKTTQWNRLARAMALVLQPNAEGV